MGNVGTGIDQCPLDSDQGGLNSDMGCDRYHREFPKNPIVPRMDFWTPNWWFKNSDIFITEGVIVESISGYLDKYGMFFLLILW